MEFAPSHFDLLDAFETAGCPICRLTDRAVERYIAAINYEAANDPGYRAILDASWGFCNLHAHLWLARVHPLGTALIYEAILGRLDDLIESVSPRGRRVPRQAIASLLQSRGEESPDHAIPHPSATCPVCDIRAGQEREAATAMIQGLSAARFREAYRASTGLCIPHLRLTLSTCRDSDVFDMVKKHAIAQNEALRGQLREFIRKQDYRYRDEPVGAEQDAVERAVSRVTGIPGISDR